MSDISSPCILVCSIDLKSGHCFGCGRTSSEITEWIDMAETQRLEIMQLLPDRIAAIERKPRRVTKRRRMAAQANDTNKQGASQ